MRLKRPRFTLRWMMVGVAVAALCCFHSEMTRRRADYLRRARVFRRACAFSGILARYAREKHDEVRAAEMNLKDRYFRRMQQKYERAADHPWLSVPPDPPHPLETSKVLAVAKKSIGVISCPRPSN